MPNGQENKKQKEKPDPMVEIVVKERCILSYGDTGVLATPGKHTVPGSVARFNVAKLACVSHAGGEAPRAPGGASAESKGIAAAPHIQTPIVKTK